MPGAEGYIRIEFFIKEKSPEGIALLADADTQKKSPNKLCKQIIERIYSPANRLDQMLYTTQGGLHMQPPPSKQQASLDPLEEEKEKNKKIIDQASIFDDEE